MHYTCHTWALSRLDTWNSLGKLTWRRASYAILARTLPPSCWRKCDPALFTSGNLFCPCDIIPAGRNQWKSIGCLLSFCGRIKQNYLKLWSWRSRAGHFFLHVTKATVAEEAGSSWRIILWFVFFNLSYFQELRKILWSSKFQDDLWQSLVWINSGLTFLFSRFQNFVLDWKFF